jgi:hypothetical protein
MVETRAKLRLKPYRPGVQVLVITMSAFGVLLGTKGDPKNILSSLVCACKVFGMVLAIKASLKLRLRDIYLQNFVGENLLF